MKNKKGFEFSFGWLFAMIVGAAILFLAIYAAVKLISTERTAQETETAKQLELILTPVETGYEEGKTVPAIVFPTETRVYNNCSLNGNFGEQSIKIATSSNLGKKWEEAGFPIVSYNKYIFSPSMMQGKEMYVFSKPIKMPFKIANLLFMWNEEYCFVNPPPEIEEEIVSLNLNKINLSDNVAKCNKKAKKVCFVSNIEQCDVVVNTLQNSVKHKDKKLVFYDEETIYGAIFSEPDLYECQITRLMRRTSNLALLYNAKSESLAARSNGCSSELQNDLKKFASITEDMNSSKELRNINLVINELETKNEQLAGCKLWVD